MYYFYATGKTQFLPGQPKYYQANAVRHYILGCSDFARSNIQTGGENDTGTPKKRHHLVLSELTQHWTFLTLNLLYLLFLYQICASFLICSLYNYHSSQLSLLLDFYFTFIITFKNKKKLQPFLLKQLVLQREQYRNEVLKQCK